jgi:hypothetical protein
MLLSMTLVTGCSDTAGAPIVPDASRIFTASSPADSGDVVDLEALGEGTGDKFSDLYRDLASPASGSAKCQNKNCHGDPNHISGLHMGATQESMYAAITTFKVPDGDFSPREVVAPQADGSDATSKSALLQILGHAADGLQDMPKLLADHSNRTLSDAQLARVGRWLKRGAPND